MKIFLSIGVGLILSVSLVLSSPLPQVFAQNTVYCTQNDIVSIEAESYSENIGYNLVNHNDASGGQGMQAGESGTLSFDIDFDQGGRWYIWLRSLAPNHTSNGMYFDFDNQRLVAPTDHIYAGESDIYLYKSASVWFWTPEWQAPGEGYHAGPVTVDTTAGLHRFSVVKRKIEDPLIDKIVFTRTNEAPVDFGPATTLCSTSPSPSPTTTPTVTPTPSATPTPTTTPSPTPTTSTACMKADINQDNQVNLTDFSLLANDFFSTSPSNPRSDINADGIVNLADFSLLSGQFFKTCG